MGDIRYEVEDGVATVAIDRPEKRNALTFTALADLDAAIRRAGEDEAVRAVVLTGRGGAFSAGTDLADLAATPAEARVRARDGDRATHPWPIVACPKPVIAAVDGPAVGLGAELATQCDVRIASTRARFGWVFVLRGLVADTGAGTFLLPRLIGPTAAVRLLYSGEMIDAAEALRLGLVTAVVEPDELMAAAHAEARRYLAASPFALRRTKQLVYAGLSRSVEEHVRETARLLQECFRSEDHREGVAAFLERRPARFTGR